MIIVCPNVIRLIISNIRNCINNNNADSTLFILKGQSLLDMALYFQQNDQLFDMSFHSISLHLLLKRWKVRIYKKGEGK